MSSEHAEAASASLEGRVAVVTGASRRIGIGAAIALALAAKKADVFVTYYRPYDATWASGSAEDDVDQLLAGCATTAFEQAILSVIWRTPPPRRRSSTRWSAISARRTSW